ncbi:2-oxoglutarate dehydrogenase complex dihydrolipoyllysine-residue succinyltransferase [Candidatus Pantoea edessiphila]|uniref:Dihydrolipoyllysine-residue succinyltransferase n=1 Tax=Candidatus Pantoea edessiphila TaxID=2044610 RepID=A0A2P5SX51_9GAMM|nr:2-oxoglutarate dehydrogenase complex dihydrolipoyllysine-residue succinyltransferase [Candidatus Pantoea edessiphila]PPI86882.1 dihydrolipoyllysine-residue succinyltransferase [Candidatus Pantoea edessiphila]
MSILEIIVPDLPESVVDASISIWNKKPGDQVNIDEILVEIETDKVIIEIPAVSNGILETILEDKNSVVKSRQVIGLLKINNDFNNNVNDNNNQDQKNNDNNPDQKKDILINQQQEDLIKEKQEKKEILTPSIRRFIAKYDLDISKIKNDYSNQRITMEKVKNLLEYHNNDNRSIINNYSNIDRVEKSVPMTRLRKRIAERLIAAKNSTAMLTTFNEVNMASIINIRKQYGDLFERIHGVRLGFMSFYVKAVIEALKQYPEINAFIDGDNVIYHNYFDVSIAISTPRGLITPIIHDADHMNMADIEKKIKDLSTKGRDNKLKVEELTGGNFTITNGGVFGSLMSTPILNPPQSAILGMHAIQDRPVAVQGEVVILPMMYLALSYDHRLIDGREAIGYLVKIKELLEDPIRLLLDI